MQGGLEPIDQLFIHDGIHEQVFFSSIMVCFTRGQYEVVHGHSDQLKGAVLSV